MHSFRKPNKKQLAWSHKKVSFAIATLFKQLFSLLVVLLVGIASFYAFTDPTATDVVCNMAGGGIFLILMSMAQIGNIEDDSDINSQAGQWAYELKLIETNQVDSTVPFPMPNASREMADITLLAGEKPHRFVSHSRPTYLGSGELNDYTIDPSKEIQIALANAFRDNVLNYVEQKSGGKFILFFRRIETSQWYMIGTLDQPLRFSGYQVKGDNEASVAMCTFSHKSIRQYYKYVGALSDVAAETVAADATNLAVTDNDRYQLTDNTGATAIATVSGIAAADYGRTITIYGSGGSNPSTIADNAVFTLVEGATWTGNAGSKISFRILDSGTLVEISGSRVQTA